MHDRPTGRERAVPGSATAGIVPRSRSKILEGGQESAPCARMQAAGEKLTPINHRPTCAD
jgi:hypothetical protein